VRTLIGTLVRTQIAPATVRCVEQMLDRTLLAHAVDHSPDGILIVNRDGTIFFANSTAVKMAGAVGMDLVGTSVDELLPESMRAAHREHRRNYAANASQRPMGSGLDLTMLRSDGHEVPVEVSLSPLEHDGETYVIAAIRDVTERAENQRRLAVAHEQLSLAGERARIGRDLHDVVLQHLFGMGLTMQAIAQETGPATAGRLDAVIDDVDRIISEVRTIVFTLGTSLTHGSLGQELADVMAQSSRVLGFTPSLRLEGPVESVINEEIRLEMVASMREALGNVARHAGAARVEVVVQVKDGHVLMQVCDDGVGPPAELSNAYSGGHGLANLRARAAMLGGSCSLTSSGSGGALLIWNIPYR
jgi:PAS domain S-box-containing protein